MFNKQYIYIEIFSNEHHILENLSMSTSIRYEISFEKQLYITIRIVPTLENHLKTR